MSVTRLSLQDRTPITRRVVDKATGFMRVPAVYARTGIQTYLAGELGLKDRPASDQIKVYRPPEEVFNADSMASFAGKPVTDDHPPVMVDASNCRTYSRGHSSDSVTRTGEVMGGDLTITDQALIKKIEAGKEEISNGYTCDLEWTSGQTPAGETHDAIMRNIRGNHIAVVDAGRCGPECRVADQAPAPGGVEVSDCGCGKGATGMADAALRKITLDGIPVETTDAGAAAIESLQRKLADTTSLHTQALAAKDGEIAALKATHASEITAKDAEITTLKGQIVDTATLDARANARAKLIGDAKRLVGDKAPELVTDGKSDLEIQKAAVTLKLGDAATKDRPDAFFTGAFDTLLLQVPTDGGTGGGRGTGDPMRDHLRGGGDPPPRPPERQETRDGRKPSYEDRMSSRWKSGTSKGA